MMKFQILILLALLLIGCGQDFSTGMQIACAAADGVNPGDQLDATAQAKEREKARVTNPEVQELLESMRSMAPEQRHAVLQTAVKRANLNECALLTAMNP